MAGRAPAAEDAGLDSREESGADDEQLDLLGVLDNKIVGIQYYGEPAGMLLRVFLHELESSWQALLIAACCLPLQRAR